MPTVYKTKQKEEILDYLRSNAEKCLTAEDITEALKNSGVGKTTVYRALKLLKETGAIREYPASHGESALYQFVENEECKSHVHLRCIKCGSVLHMDCGFNDDLAAHLKQHHGFVFDSSLTTFYGTCEKCLKGKKDND